jgi:hypothetical protein
MTAIPYGAEPVMEVPVPTTLLLDYSRSDQWLPDYNRIEQRLPIYGQTKLRMPEMSKGDSRTLASPTKRELQMPKPMVDILTGDYYHPEPAKRS